MVLWIIGYFVISLLLIGGTAAFLGEAPDIGSLFLLFFFWPIVLIVLIGYVFVSLLTKKL